VEYILIGVLITFGSWLGGEMIEKIDKKEMVPPRQEVLQCVIVEPEEEDVEKK
jgi:hypothetical protein